MDNEPNIDYITKKGFESDDPFIESQSLMPHVLSGIPPSESSFPEEMFLKIKKARKINWPI